jgi:CBS domain-containing protein
MKASRVMSIPVWSCAPETNLSCVVQTMWKHDCGIVPVVDDNGRAIGIVTDRDICIALGTRNQPASTVSAREVMSQSVVGCAPDDDCFTVLQLMERQRVRRLPVLGTGDVLLGIVSLDDIVKRAAAAPAGDPLRHGVISALATLGGHQSVWPLERVAVVGAG